MEILLLIKFENEYNFLLTMMKYHLLRIIPARFTLRLLFFNDYCNIFQHLKKKRKCFNDNILGS